MCDDCKTADVREIQPTFHIDQGHFSEAQPVRTEIARAHRLQLIRPQITTRV